MVATVNRLIRFTLAVAIGLVAFLPWTVQAQYVEGQAIIKEYGEVSYVEGYLYSLEQPISGVTSVKDAGEYLQLVYQLGLGLVGIIAVVIIMFGGLMWVQAAGNEQSISKAKELIVSAVVGLLIALLSYTILVFVNPDLLKLNMRVLVIPINQSANDMPVCGTDSPLTEPTGTRACGAWPTSTHAVVSAEELNGWIEKYNTGAVQNTFVKAIMKQESSFCMGSYSGVACGIMQMLPTTAAGYASTCSLTGCAGITSDSSQAEKDACCNQLVNNVEGAVCAGTTMLNRLMSNSYTQGTERLSAAAYNGGTCNESGDKGALCESTSCIGQLVFECPENHTGPESYEQTFDYVNIVAKHKEEFCKKNAGGQSCVTVRAQLPAGSGTFTAVADFAYCQSGTAAAGYQYQHANCTGAGSVSCPTIGSDMALIKLGTCGKAYSKHYEFAAGSSYPSTSPPDCVDNIPENDYFGSLNRP